MHLAPVLAAIRRRERQKILAVALLLLFGLPATFFGPVALTSIYWLTAVLWGFYWPWTCMLALSCLLLTPVLFATEWKFRGNYFTDAVLDTFSEKDSSLPATGLSDVNALISLIQNPASVRGLGIGLTECFLWGPTTGH